MLQSSNMAAPQEGQVEILKPCQSPRLEGRKQGRDPPDMSGCKGQSYPARQPITKWTGHSAFFGNNTLGRCSLWPQADFACRHRVIRNATRQHEMGGPNRLRTTLDIACDKGVTVQTTQAWRGMRDPGIQGQNQVSLCPQMPVAWLSCRSGVKRGLHYLSILMVHQRHNDTSTS